MPNTKPKKAAKVTVGEIVNLRDTIIELKTAADSQEAIIKQLRTQHAADAVQIATIQNLKSEHETMRKTIARLEETGKKHWWN